MRVISSALYAYAARQHVVGTVSAPEVQEDTVPP